MIRHTQISAIAKRSAELDTKGAEGAEDLTAFGRQEKEKVVIKPRLRKEQLGGGVTFSLPAVGRPVLVTRAVAGFSRKPWGEERNLGTRYGATAGI